MNPPSPGNLAAPWLTDRWITVLRSRTSTISPHGLRSELRENPLAVFSQRSSPKGISAYLITHTGTGPNVM